MYRVRLLLVCCVSALTLTGCVAIEKLMGGSERQVAEVSSAQISDRKNSNKSRSSETDKSAETSSNTVEQNRKPSRAKKKSSSLDQLAETRSSEQQKQGREGHRNRDGSSEQETTRCKPRDPERPWIGCAISR